MMTIAAAAPSCGAPREAFHLRGRRPHLDLKLEPRERALVDPEVQVFETTRELLKYLRRS